MSKDCPEHEDCMTVTPVELAKIFIDNAKKRELDIKTIEPILKEMDVEDFVIFLAKITEHIADAEEMKANAVPRYCPKGCGQTVIASKLTDKEWEVSKRRHPELIREKSWHIKCTKCNYQTFIGGFN